LLLFYTNKVFEEEHDPWFHLLLLSSYNIHNFDHSMMTPNTIIILFVYSESMSIKALLMLSKQRSIRSSEPN
jgi:hypothetical protein